MKSVKLFTDGSCSRNPGPGGWGAILQYAGHEKELSGGAVHTTNNRMELSAVIAGLEQLKEPCAVTLTSDSKYVCDAITKGWARGWEKNGWRKNDKSAVSNVDLWKKLLALLDTHKVTIVWVRGHTGHPENERCDKLAKAQTSQFSAKAERVDSNES